MKRRKIIALLLSFMLLFSLLPNGAAWAEDQDGVEISSPSDADEGEINEAEVEGLDVQEPRIQLRQLVSPLAAPVIKGAPGGNDSDGEPQSGESGLTENNEISQTIGSGNPDTSNMVFVQFDNLSSISEADKKLTFKVGDKSYDVTVNYVSELAGDVIWVTEGENKGIYINADDSVLANVKFVVPQTFRDDRNGIRIIVGSSSPVELSISGDNECNLAGLRLVAGNVIHFEPYSSGGGGGKPQQEGNTKAQINLETVDGSWSGDAAVWESYYEDNEDGTFTVPYNKSKYEVSFAIENSDRSVGRFTDALEGPYEEAAEAGRLAKLDSQIISYNKDNSTASDTVNLVVRTRWSNVIEKIEVNGKSYNVPINYSDKGSYLNAYRDQAITMVIPIKVAEPNNIAPEGEPEEPAERYNIKVKVRPVTLAECYVGNFLWTNDDYFAPDPDDDWRDDMYIGHATLVLQSVDFEDGTGSHHWELNVNDNGQSEEKNYVDEEGRELPYVHFFLNREGYAGDRVVKTSEMLIPAGAKVTMRITPDPGYQVTQFTGVDYDEGTVQLPGGQCVYTFTVGKGNFHIGAIVEEVENDSEVASKAVKKAGIAELPEGVINAGTARLYVADAELSVAKEAAFEAEAAKEGLAIENVLDVSLAQVFFKGNGHTDDVWANPKEELEEPALLGIQLEGDYTGKDVEFIHNIHDGEAFETIEPVEFDRANNIAYFEADSFSSYAIATKPIKAETPKDETKEATVTPAKKAEVKSTKPATADNFNIVPIVAMVVVSAAGIVFVVRRKRMIGK